MKKQTAVNNNNLMDENQKTKQCAKNCKKSSTKAKAANDCCNSTRKNAENCGSGKKSKKVEDSHFMPEKKTHNSTEKRESKAKSCSMGYTDDCCGDKKSAKDCCGKEKSANNAAENATRSRKKTVRA